MAEYDWLEQELGVPGAKHARKIGTLWVRHVGRHCQLKGTSVDAMPFDVSERLMWRFYRGDDGDPKDYGVTRRQDPPVGHWRLDGGISALQKALRTSLYRYYRTLNDEAVNGIIRDFLAYPVVIDLFAEFLLILRQLGKRPVGLVDDRPACPHHPGFGVKMTRILHKKKPTSKRERKLWWCGACGYERKRTE